MFDMLRLAAEIAVKRIDIRDYYVGAIGIRYDNVMVHARNEASERRNQALHAEFRLVSKLGKNAPIVYVARMAANGQLAMAKPCVYCQSILRSFKVKKVVFSTGYNTWDQMYLM